jgi:hypothetical protein
MRYRSLTFAALFFGTALISGCKLDKPVYPDGTVVGGGSTDGGGTIDTGTDATFTVGIGADNTIIFQVDGGEKVTAKNVASLTQDPDSTFSGTTNLSASLVSPATNISLSSSVSNAVGEFPLENFSLTYKVLDLKVTNGGTIKFTTYKDDQDGFAIIKGYFKVTAIDTNTGASHVIVGSFNNQ